MKLEEQTFSFTNCCLFLQLGVPAICSYSQIIPWDESYSTEISAKQDVSGQILHWELDLLPMKEQYSRIEKERHHSSLSLP